ncbi:MAG: hypothetical protein ABH848_00080 [Candidatus Omnitrophota bacterium]
MSKEKKIFTACLALAVLLSFGMETMAREELRLTTYYPSPHGVYTQLQTVTLGVNTAAPDPTTNPGDVLIGDAGDPGSLTVSGAITASGDVTASGYVRAADYYSGDNSQGITTSRQVVIGPLITNTRTLVIKDGLITDITTP